MKAILLQQIGEILSGQNEVFLEKMHQRLQELQEYRRQRCITYHEIIDGVDQIKFIDLT